MSSYVPFSTTRAAGKTGVGLGHYSRGCLAINATLTVAQIVSLRENVNKAPSNGCLGNGRALLPTLHHIFWPPGDASPFGTPNPSSPDNSSKKLRKQHLALFGQRRCLGAPPADISRERKGYSLTSRLSCHSDGTNYNDTPLSKQHLWGQKPLPGHK